MNILYPNVNITILIPVLNTSYILSSFESAWILHRQFMYFMFLNI